MCWNMFDVLEHVQRMGFTVRGGGRTRGGEREAGGERGERVRGKELAPPAERVVERRRRLRPKTAAR